MLRSVRINRYMAVKKILSKYYEVKLLLRGDFFSTQSFKIVLIKSCRIPRVGCTKNRNYGHTVPVSPNGKN